MARLTTLRRFWPVLAAAVSTGVGLWFTHASLGLFTGPRGPTRVAMLPTRLELAGLVLLASGVSAGAAVLLWRRRDHGLPDETAARHLVDHFVPLFALTSLALPYVPWLAERVPLLLVAAGSGKYLLWAIVGVQVAWIALERAAGGRSPAKIGGGAALFIAAFLIFGTAAWRLAGSALFPGGDEPHYLIIAQSLWRDHDLEIENNHARGDYQEYFHGTLPPHFQALGANGAIYSIHPIGLPVVLAPVYAIGRYHGVVAVLVVLAALTSALMWTWARRLTASAGAATFAWAAVVFSAPFLLGSFVVYPEMMAALCVIAAFSQARHDTSVGRWSIAALCVAALPWLSTKYAPMACALLVVCLFRATRARTARLIRAAVMSLTLAISLTGWLTFFAIIWGSALPSAPYGGTAQMQFQYLAKGAPGLLFDQEYGILAYAPVLLLGFTGLWTMWRRGGSERVTSLEIAAVFGSLLTTVSAYELWWGGSSTPGRPLVSGLALLACPMAWQYLGAVQPARRAAHRLLLVTSVWITGALVFTQGGFLMALGRSGTSPLLAWLSPDWRLWSLAPSFFYGGLGVAAAFVGIWLAAGLGSRLVLDAIRNLRPGAAALAATTSAGVVLLLLWAVVPWLFGSRLQPEVSLEARGRIGMLDDFDSRLRPLAVVYDPLRPVVPAYVPALFSLSATPGQRRGRQPVDVLFNARFALPAGRYVAVIRPTHGIPTGTTGELSLQVGRTGDPLSRWDVRLEPGQEWRHEFSLPIDAGFVGFRESPSLRQVVSEIRVLPLSVLDVHDRLGAGEVLGAASYGSTTVYAHDDYTWLESTGFWTGGAATTSITLAPTRGGLTLNVRSERPNSIAIDAGTWRSQLELEPGVARDVQVPPSTREDGLVSLRVTSASGFTPASVQPGNRDQRFLGCWIQIETSGDR